MTFDPESYICLFLLVPGEPSEGGLTRRDPRSQLEDRTPSPTYRDPLQVDPNALLVRETLLQGVSAGSG